MHLPNFGQTITNREKRLIFGPPTQALLPLKYKFIYDSYKNGIKNSWTPEEIGLLSDKLDYAKLPANAKNQWDLVLSMLTVLDMVVTDSLGEHVMPAASAPEFRAWLARQQFDEALHSDSYAFIIESLGLDQQAVFDRYLTDETLFAKTQMSKEACGLLGQSTYWNSVSTAQNEVKAISAFLKGYAFFPLVLEGIWFVMGLKCGTYATQYHRLMRGTTDQFAYIIRDEMLHCNVGINVIQTIKAENPSAWTEDVKQYILDLVTCGIEAEEAFAKRAYVDLPGLSWFNYIEHCKHRAEQMLVRLELSLFPNARPAIPWLSDAIEKRRETNFFERRVTEYQQGTGLNWDDD